MVFSSLIFVFLFLPVTLLVYFLAKDEYRNYILLAFSLLFYAYGEPKFVFVMLLSICANYVIALLIDKNRDSRYAKGLLAFAILINVLILGIFKYLGFSERIINSLFHANIPIANIALPIGISFFTFQAMSYVIDVYRNDVKVQKNLFYLALYIAFFPQLIAGPIVRYSTIEEQIRHRVCTMDLFGDGVKRLFLGFGKKILLANNLAIVAEEIFAMDLSTANPALLWLGSICFSTQLYYDFSGYSDMAIGLAKMFGFRLEENFNYPYMSGSISEFWRRWHISLGNWFRDYVYIPMGGSRVSVPRYIFNVFVLWMLTGIWHGANYNYIAWGIGYFVLLIVERFFVKINTRGNVFKVVWRVISLFLINFLMVTFNVQSVKRGIIYNLCMMGYNRVPWSIDSQLCLYFREYGVFIICGVLFCTSIVPFIEKQLDKNDITKTIKDYLVPVGYGIIFLWSVSYLLLGAHNPFIYFNF